MAGYVQKLRNQLMEKREKLLRRPVGVVSLFVLGSSSADAPKCLYLHTDHDRYLFNVGEGSQRLSQELKLKLRRIRNIFITHESWEKVSGLPGIAMALRDLGVLNVNIYGPTDVTHVLRDASRFVRLQGLFVGGRICETGGSFEDEALKIIFAPLSTSSGDRAVCYVVLPKDRKPVLNPQRCAELGLRPGPIYATLKSGGEVTVDGKVITSAQVTSPAEPPFVMLIIDAPTTGFMQSLEQSPILSQHTNANLVVHFTPLDVMRDPTYMRWMRERFEPATVHLLVNEASAYGAGKVAAVQQMFLHQLVPSAFPLLRAPSVFLSEDAGDRVPERDQGSGFDNTIPPPLTDESWRALLPGISNLVPARPLLEYRLKPPSQFNILRCPELDLPKESSEIQSKISQANQNSIQNLFSAVRTAEYSRDEEYPCIIFTGTGGAVPSPMRNTAGILVQLSMDHSLLFDCAEGTLGQLIRLLGQQETSRILSTLKAIFISHPHADHVLGLPMLIKARAAKQSVPINIVAPTETIEWLVSCSRRGFITDLSFRRFDDRLFITEPHSLANILGVTEAKLGRMDHCPDAYGIAVQDDSGKITYSGDTAPNEDLVSIDQGEIYKTDPRYLWRISHRLEVTRLQSGKGMNSDILINEATLGTVLPGLARNKRHCTTQNALDLARKMKASNTILTHFSTRYARIPQLMDLENASNTIIAFDNMVVRPSLLNVLPYIIQPLSEIYSDKLRRMRRKENRQH